MTGSETTLKIGPSFGGTGYIPEEQNLYSSNVSPGPAQKRLAFLFVLGLIVLFFLITWPLRGVQPGPNAAFIPAYATAMFVNDWITAVLLFAQFSVLRTRALVVIASGYLFTALILIPWISTFPTELAPTPPFGGLQTTSALYLSWHAGFTMFVIAYALSKDAAPSKQLWRGTVGAAIALSFVLTTVLVTAVGMLCVLLDPFMPIVASDIRTLSPLWIYYVGVPIMALSIVAIVILWIRRRSILDLWLLVVMCLYAVEVPLQFYPDPVRFSVGFYAVRIIGLISSGVILTMLLYEILAIYRLLGVQAQRREREARLLTGGAVAATIAHEIKQPLSGMITRADAGLRFLESTAPNLEEVREAFESVIADGHRADAVIGGIRSIFRKEAAARTSVSINSLIGDTIRLLRDDLSNHQIVVDVTPNELQPLISGDQTQLQQVLVNLIGNAIHSMASVAGARILSIKSEYHGESEIWVSVSDTGAGIGARDIEQIFNPLFTTKSEGLGMGLPICKSIIEFHNGRLWFVPNTPQGAIFYFSSVRAIAS